MYMLHAAENRGGPGFELDAVSRKLKAFGKGVKVFQGAKLTDKPSFWAESATSYK